MYIPKNVSFSSRETVHCSYSSSILSYCTFFWSCCWFSLIIQYSRKKTRFSIQGQWLSHFQGPDRLSVLEEKKNIRTITSEKYFKSSGKSISKSLFDVIWKNRTKLFQIRENEWDFIAMEWRLNVNDTNELLGDYRKLVGFIANFLVYFVVI